MSKKKIVVAEMLYPKGHRTLNQRYIEVLSLNYDVIIVDDGNYFTQLQMPNNVKVLKVLSWKPSVSRFLKIKKIVPFLKYDPLDFVSHLFNLVIISVRLLFCDYHKIIFMSVRNDVISIALPLFKRNSVIAFHHYDIDHLQSHSREIPLFKRGMNKMNHIVLAEFIKKGWLKQFKIEPNRVHVVHQPLVDFLRDMSLAEKKREPTVISLGLTIDDALLKEILARDKEIKEKLPYTIILRHSTLNYVGLNVKVISGYLDREVYNDYLNTAAACLVLYPTSYQLRYSGVIDDALGHAMRVFGNNIEVVRYFAKKYPQSCTVINTMDDLFNLTIACEGMNRQEYSLFLANHKDSEIIKQFESVI